MEPVWTFEHSVDCHAPAEFIWSFWTNVNNWLLDADVISVEIHGPFAAGTTGVTQTRSSGKIEWRIADAEDGRAILEFPAPGALATFAWTFQPMAEHTRMTQRASLAGEQALMFAQSIAASLEAGIPAGMQKMSAAIEAAYRQEPA
jgi:hypothetical protein